MRPGMQRSCQHAGQLQATSRLSETLQSPETWPVGPRGGIRYSDTERAMCSVCSMDSSSAMAINSVMCSEAVTLKKRGVKLLSEF